MRLFQTDMATSHAYQMERGERCVRDVLQAERRMEAQERGYEWSRYRDTTLDEGIRMGRLRRTRKNGDERHMAWAPVICGFSRSRGDASELRRIEQATSRSGPPLLQTTESGELRPQEQDQPDNKQLAGMSLDHGESLYLIQRL